MSIGLIWSGKLIVLSNFPDTAKLKSYWGDHEIIYYQTSTTSPWFPVVRQKWVHRCLEASQRWTSTNKQPGRSAPMCQSVVSEGREWQNDGNGRRRNPDTQQKSSQVINHLIVSRKERVPRQWSCCFSTAPSAGWRFTGLQDAKRQDVRGALEESAW